MKFLAVLCVLLALSGIGFSLDREAFTFTKYDLNVQLEPEQQRLAARGTVTLRNDSSSPQKIAVLQISSSLTWHSIQAEGKPLQFVSQPYESDIDHTGELSEAIVTLSKEIPPGGSVELEIGYEGVIVLDATRLTRIGVPKETAIHSDWDQISGAFTAVRGVGYVAWYPVAMDAASLSDENAVFETIGRWKSRHANSQLNITLGATSVTKSEDIYFSGTPSLLTMVNPNPDDGAKYRAFGLERFGSDVPTFMLADYERVPAEGLSVVAYRANDKDAAATCVDALAEINSAVRVSRFEPKMTILQLADPKSAPFATTGMALTPLSSPLTRGAELMLAFAFTREQMMSPRWWIRDGLGRYGQAAYIQQRDGRAAAMEYLKSRLPILVEAEHGIVPGHATAKANGKDDRALINSSDEAYVETKAMYVWWMLNEMLGEPLLGKLFSYQATSDTKPEYLQQVLETVSKRDLQWFFDDWVYHDRGLPDFRVESAFTRKASQDNYLVTITVENLGAAGAEVPVTVAFDGGDTTQKVEVRGNAKGTIRIATPSPPTQVIVNEGSVPESDMSNNVFKVESSNK
jgi:hypothetical protein